MPENRDRHRPGAVSARPPGRRRARCLTAGLAVAAALAVASPAGAQRVGGDYVSSNNVELITRIKTPGDGVGARVVGNYLYVTSTKDLEIFDISTPESPRLIGTFEVNVEWENEDVPTNGKLLGISGTCMFAVEAGSTDCLTIYDVSNPASIRRLRSVGGAGDHTQSCLFDCNYFWGSEGAVVDATQVLAPGAPAKMIGNWKTEPEVRGCHDVEEVSPGLVLGACQPIPLVSARPQDGGSVTAPKLLATGENEDGRFIHSVLWPRGGTDRFILAGGETNAQPQCHSRVGAFMTWDASRVYQTRSFSMIDEWRPSNGNYLNSHPPNQILGCSVHWFDEHPTFRDGGLVAVAAYENGTRFMQVGADGKLKEQGYFVPLGGSTSAPHWSPDGKVVYNIDYGRGIDVLRYTGEHYVPGEGERPGAVKGTEGGGPPPAREPVACVSSAGFKSVRVRPGGGGGRGSARAAARGAGLDFVVSRRVTRPFNVDVFQESAGPRMVNRHVASLRNKTGSFSWNGRGNTGRRVTDGHYIVRLVMRLPNGRSDIRRIAVQRRGGRFLNRPASYMNDRCGILGFFKLRRSAFGGRRNRPLGIAYRVPHGADSVSVVALRGARVIKRFNAGKQRERTYKFELPAKGLPRGTDVRVRVTVRRINAKVVSTLTARRV